MPVASARDNAGCAAEFAHRAAARRDAINRYLWDEAAGVYLDYRWTTACAGAANLRGDALSFVRWTCQPAAGGRRARRRVSRDLLKAGGIVTTPLASGQQWDAPNGWAPLQWIGISGLRRYSLAPLAQTIACRWMQSVNRVYEESGKLVEKYDVISIGRSGGGGEYPTQDGFGWTNGVLRKLMALYPEYAERSSAAAQCPA